MEQFYHITLAQKGAGLFNQIFTIVTAVILAFFHSRRVVVVEAFSKDFETIETCPLSEVLNLKILNDFIYKEYKVIVVDKQGLDLNILTCNNSLDQKDLITTVKDIYKNYSSINFKERVNIKYSVNGYIFQDEIENITFPNMEPPVYPFGWINTVNRPMFEKILDKIEFTFPFKLNAYKFIFKQPITNGKINTLHLRIEDDMVKYAAKIENKSESEIRDHLHKNYIEIIQKYVPKDDLNIILCYSTNNPVITFLKENGYNFIMSEKDPTKGREINGIHDYLIGTFANNIFLGALKSDLSTGSTFAICIYKKLRPGVKCILWGGDEPEIIIK